MLSYRISYSVDLQIYTYRKHFSDVGFKASKIHLKMGRIFVGSEYIAWTRLQCCLAMKLNGTRWFLINYQRKNDRPIFTSYRIQDSETKEHGYNKNKKKKKKTSLLFSSFRCYISKWSLFRIFFIQKWKFVYNHYQLSNPKRLNSAVSSQCARGISSIARKPEVHPKPFRGKNLFQKCNKDVFNFITVS